MRASLEQRLPWIGAGILTVIFAVGTIGHLVSAVRPLVVPLTWYVLLLNGLLVLFPLAPQWNPRLALWCAGAYAAGFLLEAVGVGTGMIFGPYSYGDVLGPALLGVPLLIGLNWALVILGCVTLASVVVRRALPAAIVAGAFTVLFDWLMEPVAVRLGYWSWAGGAIPLRNYAAWFLISSSLALMAAAFFAPALRVHPTSRLAALSTCIQLVFFLLLRFTIA